ncbi:MAG: caspase family protein, partial [Myxococcota bacterium]
GDAVTWSVAEASPTARLRSRTALTTSLAPSPDGRYVAVAHGIRATIWDLGLGQPARVLEGHAGGIQQLRWSPDGRTLFTAAADTGAVAWEAATGEAQAVFIEQHRKGLRDIAVAPDGASILTGGTDGLVVWWDVATQEPRRRLEGHGKTVHAVAFSPDGARALTAGDDGRAIVWDLATGKVLNTVILGGKPAAPVLSAAFSGDGRSLLLGTVYRQVLRVDATDGRVLASVRLDGPVGALSQDGEELVAGTFSGTTTRLDPTTLAVQERFDRLDSFVLDAHAVPGTPFVASAGMDGTVRFFAKGRPQAIATLVSAEQDWVVTDPDGRYDAAADAAEELAVWVVDGAPYALSQLRDEFFDPGLLAKALGTTKAPMRRVPRLAMVTPPPRAQVTGPDPTGRATVAFEDRGGGIGTVFATLNDSDVSAWLASACAPFETACTVDLSGLPTWTKGLDNRLRIAVSNREGSVRSRGLVRAVTASGRPPGDAPDLWVLAVGSSDYAGSGLDLRYPALDASRLGLAMRLAGRTGFGVNRTHVRVLATSELANVAGPPSRRALQAAFAWLGQSDANDTVLVFMAGHGVAMTDSDQGVDDYFYLLPSVGSVDDLTKPELRALRTWSGNDLADALARVPARKRVVVLDTCAAGKLDQSLTLERTLSSDAIRAHVRARHRTGAWVLAGSAADQVSYEATRFGQGLLTYALLEGMQGPALDEGSQLWVSRWFAHAEASVPQHARDIGGVQRPV